MFSVYEQEDYIFPGEETDPASRRQKLFDNMMPELKRKVTTIETWFANDYKRIIQNRFQLGLELKEIHNDVEKRNGARFGRDALRQMLKYFSWGKETLYAARRLADQYSQKEIDKICTMKCKNGQPIFFTHLRVLFPLEDSQRRWQLLQEVVEQSLDCTELACRVAEETGYIVPGKLRKNKRGRSVGIPKGFDGIVNQQVSFASDFYDRSVKVWEDPDKGLTSRAKSLSQEEITQERLETVKNFVETMMHLAGKARLRFQEATEVYEYLKERHDGLKSKDEKPVLKYITGEDILYDQVKVRKEKATHTV